MTSGGGECDRIVRSDTGAWSVTTGSCKASTASYRASTRRYSACSVLAAHSCGAGITG